MLDVYIIKKILDKLKEQSKSPQTRLPVRDYRGYHRKKKEPKEDKDRGVVIIDMRQRWYSFWTTSKDEAPHQSPFKNFTRAGADRSCCNNLLGRFPISSGSQSSNGLLYFSVSCTLRHYQTFVDICGGVYSSQNKTIKKQARIQCSPDPCGGIFSVAMLAYIQRR